MTSKLTIEFMQNIISGHGFGVAPSAVKAMAEYIVAAMDSEPVAEILSSRPGNDTSTIDRALPVGTQLYRHAQPAPDAIPVSRDIDAGYLSGWNDCRAAMLQELPKSAGESNNCRSSENVQVMQVMQDVSRCSTKSAPAMDSPPKTAESRVGNSPAIPDGYVMVPKEPTAEMQSAGASAIRFDTTAVNKLWTGNAVFRAMLAAAPQEVKGE